ncbi:hypothetical protein M8J75_016533 [Diaphorina citri]|nr:hypothetical protein M8J75_016533 [Diaphorina citri]
MPKDSQHKVSKKNKIKNKDSGYRVSKVANIQIMDIVHNCSQENVLSDQIVDTNVTIGRTEEDANVTIDRTEDEHNITEETIHPSEDPTSATDEVSDAIKIDPIVPNMPSLTLSDAIVMMNNKFAKKMAAINDNTNTSEQDDNMEVSPATNRKPEVGEDLVNNENMESVSDAMITTEYAGSYMGESNSSDNESKKYENENNIINQQGSHEKSRIIIISPSYSQLHRTEIDKVPPQIDNNNPLETNSNANSLANQFFSSQDSKISEPDMTRNSDQIVGPMDNTSQNSIKETSSNTNTRQQNNTTNDEIDNNVQSNIPDNPRLFYETSGDIPMNETETESGIKEREDLLQKHIKEHRESPNENKRKKNRQTRNRSRSKKRSEKTKKDKKYILMNDVNNFYYNNNVYHFICTVVINICITLIIAFLLRCSISRIIENKINHQTQCILRENDIMNQTFYSSELMHLNTEKLILDAKFKYLMDRYHLDDDEVLKHVKNNNPFNKTEANTPYQQESHKDLVERLKLRKQLYKDLAALQKETQKTIRKLARSKQMKNKNIDPYNTY